MHYRIELSKDAEDDLNRLQKPVAQRIRDKLLFLETVTNPRKYLDKIEGKYNGRVYRYRIGNYRAYLTFKDEVMVIVVVQIGHRKNIYKT
ncbi:MAG: type II toxin-antitoxin system RelE/ParE family toxin [Methanospirillaceae archaeon]|nr:type II toxin-antitoxin system RelE/ParE family toxin [Methanospirillaceae archaeon]